MVATWLRGGALVSLALSIPPALTGGLGAFPSWFLSGLGLLALLAFPEFRRGAVAGLLLLGVSIPIAFLYTATSDTAFAIGTLGAVFASSILVLLTPGFRWHRWGLVGGGMALLGFLLMALDHAVQGSLRGAPPPIPEGILVAFLIPGAVVVLAVLLREATMDSSATVIPEVVGERS